MRRTEAHAHSKVSEWVTIFTTMNNYAKQLVTSSYHKNVVNTKDLEETFKKVEAKLGNNIDTLRQLLKENKHASQ